MCELQLAEILSNLLNLLLPPFFHRMPLIMFTLFMTLRATLKQDIENFPRSIFFSERFNVEFRSRNCAKACATLL